jgi:FkbM family methyltransferase
MSLRSSLGLARSMWLYRRPGRLRGLMQLYRPFVSRGDLVFDIGAHLGDRTRAFRRLGARVVALEPQPGLMQWLRRFHGSDDEVVLCARAVGERRGHARLALSETHPAVASLSAQWRREVSRHHSGFEAVRWPRSIEVDVVTLDDLIAAHGRPAFCKIDVEGHEAAVLEGLSEPLPALSFEFVAGALERADQCIDSLERLGSCRYNAVAGERREYLWSQWRPARAVREWLAAGAGGLASGDLYAIRSGGDTDHAA